MINCEHVHVNKSKNILDINYKFCFKIQYNAIKKSNGIYCSAAAVKYENKLFSMIK